MKLLNCMCGAKALTDDHYIVCSNADCYTIGPDNDPTGEKWNALMAPHQPKAEPAEGFVRVRIVMFTDKEGNIYTSGIYLKKEARWYYDEDIPAIAIVTADIPLPTPIEIKGVVE